MDAARARRWSRARACVLAVLGGGPLLFAGAAMLGDEATGAAAPAAAMAALASPAGGGPDPVIISGLRYTGNSSCAGSCHSEPAPAQNNIGNELTIFYGKDGDPHAGAFKLLSSEASRSMAGKLGIADAAASSRCLACHAMDVPQGQRGDRFTFKDGVGCEACHGPAEKWLDPHSEAGWTPRQRAALGPAKLLEQLGLRDTRDLTFRARNCVACHLQIDKDLIDQGHPALEFELWAYGNYFASKGGETWTTHWEGEADPPAEWWPRMWAVGQLVAADAAAAQVARWKEKGWETAGATSLEKMYRSGAAIAKKHLGAASPEEAAKAQVSPAAATAAAAELAALAKDAASAAEARVIVYGVAALGSRAVRGNKTAEDALWDAYYAALDAAPGAGAGRPKEALVQAVQQMLDVIKRGSGGS